MEPEKLKTTDFVQVEYYKDTTYSGEPVAFWRNALYVEHQDGHHVVIYTDGTKYVLHRNMKIRKAA